MQNKLATPELFGNSRTNVCARHALITTDAHVPSDLKGWQGIVPFFLICPPMSQSFQQIMAKVEEPGKAEMHGGKIERFIFVHKGEFQIKSEICTSINLTKDDYIFLPPAENPYNIELTSQKIGSELTIFEKKYEPLEDYDFPKMLNGSLADTPAEPFLGYERALLQTILPKDLNFDMAVNYFRYETGAALPLVETHIMEHGMIMTEGQGIYRMENNYYAVCSGDVIWMAAFCPQWFVCMGDIPSAYLYYKDVNRNPIS